MRIFLAVIAVNAILFFAHNLLYTYVTPLLLDHGLATGNLSIALLLTGSVSIVGLWGRGSLSIPDRQQACWAVVVLCSSAWG